MQCEIHSDQVSEAVVLPQATTEYIPGDAIEYFGKFFISQNFGDDQGKNCCGQSRGHDDHPSFQLKSGKVL